MISIKPLKFSKINIKITILIRLKLDFSFTEHSLQIISISFQLIKAISFNILTNIFTAACASYFFSKISKLFIVNYLKFFSVIKNNYKL